MLWAVQRAPTHQGLLLLVQAGRVPSTGDLGFSPGAGCSPPSSEGVTGGLRGWGGEPLFPALAHQPAHSFQVRFRAQPRFLSP